jgi:hypothetical protein
MGFFGKNKAALILAMTMAIATGCGGSSKHRGASTVAPSTSGSTAAATTSGTTGAPGSGALTTPATTPTTNLALGPELNAVQYEDTDGDQQVSKGDKLVCTFVRDLEPVAQGLDPSVEFELLVTDDTFGTNATLEKGQANNQVAIVLGDEPQLYVSAAFDANKTTAGEASGLNVAPNAVGISGQGEGPVQPSSGALDVDGALTAAFHAAGSLNLPRGAHNGVTLDDGRVLIVGGISGTKKGDLVTEPEVYDPLADAFVKTSDLSGSAGLMKRGKVKVGFFKGTAVKLKNGDVLICGGYGVERRGFFGLGKTKIDTLESAFLFHPQTNTFERVGDMVHSRHSHTATLLDDGRVLIAGGYNDSLWRRDKTQAPLEVYDPANKRFQKLGKIFRRLKMKTARMAHSAVALRGGAEVLFSGGAYYKGGGLFGLIKPKLKAATDSEVAIGASKTEKRGAMIAARLMHASAEVSPGKVVAVGGHALSGGPVGEVEVYDANTGQWAAAGSLRAPRSNPSIAFVRTEALVIGGHTGQAETDQVEVFQRDGAQMSTKTYTLTTARNSCSVNTLPDGRVIVIGGLTGGQRSFLSVDGSPLASAEVFVSH